MVIERAGPEDVKRLFFSQVEFCDNLVFYRRAALDTLGERLLDANRTIGQPNKITVIFGLGLTSIIAASCNEQYVRDSERGCDQQRQRLRGEQVSAKSPTLLHNAHSAILPQRPTGNIARSFHAADIQGHVPVLYEESILVRLAFHLSNSFDAYHISRQLMEGDPHRSVLRRTPSEGFVLANLNVRYRMDLPQRTTGRMSARVRLGALARIM